MTPSRTYAASNLQDHHQHEPTHSLLDSSHSVDTQTPASCRMAQCLSLTSMRRDAYLRFDNSSTIESSIASVRLGVLLSTSVFRLSLGDFAVHDEPHHRLIHITLPVDGTHFGSDETQRKDFIRLDVPKEFSNEAQAFLALRRKRIAGHSQCGE